MVLDVEQRPREPQPKRRLLMSPMGEPAEFVLSWPWFAGQASPGEHALGDFTRWTTEAEVAAGHAPGALYHQRVKRDGGFIHVETWLQRGDQVRSMASEDPEYRDRWLIRFRDGQPWPDVIDGVTGAVQSEVVEAGKVPQRERPHVTGGTLVLTPDGPQPLLAPGVDERLPASAPAPPGSP